LGFSIPLFTPSGGLLYHARAFRYRARLWAPYRAALAAWLEPRLPPGDELVLVGPSAGHCLPLEHLSRFRRIYVLEPDPVARWLLAARLGNAARTGSAALRVERRDLLLEPLLADSPGLDAVLDRHPRASLLFCNLLGQLLCDLSDDDEARFKAAFHARILPRLSGRTWASIHDRWSLDRDAAEPAPLSLSFPSCPSDQELGVAYFGPSGAPVTALDHAASGLFPDAWPRSYFSWQITPRALHVIEAVSGPAP
jgi:hypothetical protein